MAEGISLALVGATSMAGESTLALLEKSALKPTELFLVDGEEGAGERIRHQGKEYLVQSLSDFDFSQADVALFVGGRELSAGFARQAAKAGSYVVDATGQLRGNESVPVVMPQVNPQALDAAGSDGLVTLPGSLTSELVSVLAPIHDKYGIERVDATAMMAVSELGKAGVDELSHQAVCLFNMRDIKSEQFPQQVVFNAVPQVGTIDSSGATDVEQSVVEECRYLLGDAALPIQLTAVWLPVFFGHSISLHLKFRDTISIPELEQVLSDVPNIELGIAPSAVEPAANSDKVYVGRVRQDSDDPTLIQLWLVADNVRFGVARNVIDVAEILEKSYI